MSGEKHMSLGDHLLSEDGAFGGMVGGTLTVARGVTAVVAGMIGDDMIVEPEADVTVNGMVSGDLVIGSGARVTVAGMIVGEVRNNGGTLAGTGMVSGTRMNGEDA
ncbi:MAG: hypothetical protein KDK28_05185 [Maritimibacter sp.]|nr:hypothetical protein [Maritimibacter sp.]